MKNRLFTLFMLAFIFTHCAKEGFPPGGPEDRTPPEVVRTIPEVGETYVDTLASVQIWFSEGIQSVSALSSIFITPHPGENVKINCRGAKITITFPQPLKSDLTYVITLGTGIKDYRNNAMIASYTLAFSTGETLDRGEITGNIYGPTDATGIDVWAYRLDGNSDSDPNPILQEPDYIVQSGAKGKFRFSNLSSGAYRLFAIRDRISDRLYQPVADEIGLTYRDAFLSDDDSLVTDMLHFKMTREDTLGPSLIRAVLTHRNHVTLLFDESLSDDQAILSPDALTIVSKKDDTDTLFVDQIYNDPLNKQRLHILTHDQNPQKEYLVTVHALTDESGNPADTLYNETSFIGTEEPDTIPPVLLQTTPEKGDRMIPLDTQIKLTFSEAMDPSHFPEGFSLSDSSDQPIMGSIQWITPAEVYYQLDGPLMSQASYTIQLSGNPIRDLAGNSIADTLFQFQTLNQDTLSAILGNVSDTASKDSGDIFITARQIQNPQISYLQILTEPGQYHFEDILPGRYIIEAFRDRDGNEQFSYGRVSPYQPSERFVVYPDTTLVRSRWPNEGNNLILP